MSTSHEWCVWLVERRIDPHIPVWDKAKRDDGTFSREDFTYDKARDIYICPGGKTLRTTGTLHSDNTYRYIARKSDCDHCPLKANCCPNAPARRIPRDPNEEARDYTRALMETEAYAVSSGQRKKVERLFGEAKTNLSLTRLRLRGLSGVRRVPAGGHRPEPQTPSGDRRHCAAESHHDRLIDASRNLSNRQTTQRHPPRFLVSLSPVQATKKSEAKGRFLWGRSDRASQNGKWCPLCVGRPLRPPPGTSS